MRVFLEGVIRLVLGIAAIYMPIASHLRYNHNIHEGFYSVFKVFLISSLILFLLMLVFEPYWRQSIKNGIYLYDVIKAKRNLYLRLCILLINLSFLGIFQSYYIQFLSFHIIIIFTILFILAHVVLIFDGCYWVKTMQQVSDN